MAKDSLLFDQGIAESYDGQAQELPRLGCLVSNTE